MTEELEKNNPGLTSLAGEWRNLLFPDASNEQFADGYAQAVTFGLLVARVRDVPLDKGLDTAANELRKSSTLIGTALRLLVDDENIRKALATSLDTLRRVLNEVHWPTVSKGDPEAWLYFYEDFLEVYDNTLRKKTGSYYTPPEVVSAMVRLTDEALRDPKLFNRREGLAAPSVTICDPAVGTGTFLLGVLRRIAATIEQDQGRGRGRASDCGSGGPHLRLRAAVRAVCRGAAAADRRDAEPDRQRQSARASRRRSSMSPIRSAIPTRPRRSSRRWSRPSASHARQANKIKRETPITVVIGNPPYKDKAGGLGGWIEHGSDRNRKLAAPMDYWMPPPEWGIGAHAQHLKNLYIYFWRWATLKVFGSGWYAATGGKERPLRHRLLHHRGRLTQRAGLPEDARRPASRLRRHLGNRLLARRAPAGGTNAHLPRRAAAGVHRARRACAEQGSREARAVQIHGAAEGDARDKFDALAKLSLDELEWVDGPTGWREPFLPEQVGAWASFRLSQNFSAGQVRRYATSDLGHCTRCRDLGAALEGSPTKSDAATKGEAFSS